MKKTTVSLFCTSLVFMNLIFCTYQIGYSVPYCNKLYYVDPTCVDENNPYSEDSCFATCNNDPSCPNNLGRVYTGEGNYLFDHEWGIEDTPSLGLFTGQSVLVKCWEDVLCITSNYQNKFCKYSGNGIWYCSSQDFKTCSQCSEGALTGNKEEIWVPEQLICQPRYALNENETGNEIVMR